MIIFMSDIICVTNRELCSIDFLLRIEEIASCSPAAIILREKNISEYEYERLAVQTLKLCKKYDVPCILHNFIHVAKDLQVDKIHVPLSVFRTMTDTDKAYFKTLGVSCHSMEEAREAEKLGCTYITAGHIFATDCKKNTPPRGIEFLENICNNVSIPVCAIGGIHPQNIEIVRRTKAKGVCIMSGLMQCKNVKEYSRLLKSVEKSTF